MTRVGTVRLTTGLVAAALAAGGAGVVASPARGDDGATAAPGPPEQAMVTPALDAGDPLAAVEEELAAAAEAASSVLPAVEAPVEDAAASPAEADEEEAPAEDETGGGDELGSAEGTETSGNQVDTASDTTPTPPSPSAGAGQTSPTNVNVSVRIGSPGDNGPVTQVNVAAALASSGAPPTSAPTESASQTPPQAARSSQSTAATPVVSPGGSTAISPAADTSAGESAWTWQWDCMSAPSFAGLSPDGSNGGSIPANWTWIWNCGGNTSQYQSATAGQYQPINVNVSVRVGSPGNDGDVRQSNVAVAVSMGASQGPSQSTSSASQSTNDSTPARDGSVAGISFPALPALVVVAPVAVLSPIAAAAETEGFAAVEEALDLLVPWLAPSGSLPTLGSAAAFVAAPSLRPAPPRIDPRGDLVAARPALGPTGRPVPVLRAPPVDTHAAAQPSRAAKPTKRASRWQAPTDTGSAPKRAPSGTSVSAAGAAGSSSGSLPIFLALPFLAAVLDLARRVALERFATPSGHRSRIPDTPG